MTAASRITLSCRGSLRGTGAPSETFRARRARAISLVDVDEFRRSLLEDLIEFQQAAARLDGTAASLRDAGDLEGAVARPFQTGAGGHVFFLSPFEKASALADSIIRRHPFVDGNKRTAAFAAARMLSLFGLLLVAEPDDLRDTILQLARGELREDDFATWLEKRSIAETEETPSGGA